ncbi:dihydropteroate synthase [Pseudooceanicola aestuarii]|uniref:dihydropteroate synthase n=1 Tax=Pseudooceanicola aestuarii TaxID=2697319 RepID=UPI0013D39883|nr:dihydropteroate synthase [Pseudooceanicola aestuarii]
MDDVFYRPVPLPAGLMPCGALPLAGGPIQFDRVEELRPGGRARLLPATALPEAWRDRLCAPRPAIAGLTLDRGRIMGILNVTPDSFSDGGQYLDPAAARHHAARMLTEGADLVDIGGESTRPGAAEVPPEEEIHRTAPVIAAIAGLGAPISIDTRKAAVAHAAIEAGAGLINDVSGLAHDPALAPLVADSGLPVCVMHMRGTPADMQDHAAYEDVLLEVYAELDARIASVEAQGIPRACILADPGIGFAKTGAQNLAILNRLSLFHGLGCPILLGVSRKRFIGTYGGAEVAAERVHGSVAVALGALDQGVQMLRVHDVAATRQAMNLREAVRAAY